MPVDPLPARGRAARCPRGWRCPAKGPTETKPRSERHVTEDTRTSAGPPSGTRVLAASRCHGARGRAERGRRTGPMGQLLVAIADPANLARAWASVRANAGAAGIDGQSVDAFDTDAERQLASLRRRLLSAERYVPPPVRRVDIPKPDGRTRPLGIPTVSDRVVQQATRQVIEPLFEQHFLPCSFGYRPGRSAQGAAWWAREAINRGDHWVAEFDIVGFFDHIRHGRLLREVAKEVDDPEVIGLIRRWLRAGVCTDEGLVPTHSGTPQGGVISPLLANIYLHRLDVEVRSGRFPADPIRRRLRDPGGSALEGRSRKRSGADRAVRHRARSGRSQIQHRAGQGRIRVSGLLVSWEVPSTQSACPCQLQGPGPCSDPAPSTDLPRGDGRGAAQPVVARVGQLLRHGPCSGPLHEPRWMDTDATAVQGTAAQKMQGQPRRSSQMAELVLRRAWPRAPRTLGSHPSSFARTRATPWVSRMRDPQVRF